MNFPDTLFPDSLLWACNAILAFMLYKIIRHAPWKRISPPHLQHVFLGTLIGIMLVWSIKAGIKPGLNFHMLGATLLTLMFGPSLALIGLLSVLVIISAFGHAGLIALGLNFLVMAFIPVLVSHYLFKWVDKKLPNHFFIFVLINSFFGAAIAMVLSGSLATFVLAQSGVYTVSYLYSNYLLYFILMGWSEAFMTGMAITLMVVYRPQWVCTFDDKRYLNR